MNVLGTIEKGFGKVNSTVFRQVNRVTDWWNLPTPLGLLNLRGLRDDLRESNLFDTRAPANGDAPPTREDLPSYRTYDGGNQDPTDPEMGKVGTRFGRNAPTEATEPEPMPQRMEPNPREVANRLLRLGERELSRLARRGSGSAARSIPSGFVEWQAGTSDEDSFAFSIASPDHWKLADCIAIVSTSHKKTGSTEGHYIASTSPLQTARIADTPRRLDLCRSAILNRDFDAFASIVELDSDMLHAVMMTSTPALHYWKPASLEVMMKVRAWRAEGIPVCYTVDAGPNVHVICPESEAQIVDKRLREIPGVDNVLVARAGEGAKIVNGK